MFDRYRIKAVRDRLNQTDRVETVRLRLLEGDMIARFSLEYSDYVSQHWKRHRECCERIDDICAVFVNFYCAGFVYQSAANGLWGALELWRVPTQPPPLAPPASKVTRFAAAVDLKIIQDCLAVLTVLR